MALIRDTVLGFTDDMDDALRELRKAVEETSLEESSPLIDAARKVAYLYSEETGT